MLKQIGFRENRTYKADSGQVYRAMRVREDRVIVWATLSGPEGDWMPNYEEVCEVVRLVMSRRGSVEFVSVETTINALRYEFKILSLSETNPEGATR